MKTCLRILCLVLFWTSFSGETCTKAIVYGRDYHTQPVRDWFDADQTTVMKGVERALEREGFEIFSIDESKGRIVTGWRPVEVDSHYVLLFQRRDYGVSDGAYYRLTTDLTQEGSRIKVAFSTTVKTIVGPLESSGVIEKRLLTQLHDYLRSPQIEMTNVGVKKK